MLLSGVPTRRLSQLAFSSFRRSREGLLLCRYSTTRTVAEQQRTHPAQSRTQKSDSVKSKGWSQVTPPSVKLDYSFEGIAPSADGACLLSAGQIQILATVTVADSQQFVPRRQHFRSPLRVEHRERWAATGRVPYGFQKREGGTDSEKYIAALIRQALAPMLPPDFRQIVEITTTTLSSAEGVVATDLAINAASMALCRSRLPLTSPVAATRIAEKKPDGAKILLAASSSGVVMLQAQGGKLTEEDLLEACHGATQQVRELLVEHERELLSRRESQTHDFKLSPTVDPAALRQLVEQGKGKVTQILEHDTDTSQDLAARLSRAKTELQEHLQRRGFFRTEAMRIPGSGCVSPLDLDLGWIELVSLCIHEMALLRGERVGGRGLLNHRKWQPVLSPLHSPHGSALCSLGATQILTAATISAPGKRDGDIIASSNLNVIQSSLNSANEQADFKAEKEAEILSAEFTEAAILPAISRSTKFPFAMRVNSEVCSEDGGETEVAVSSAALALTNAGVPLTGPVTGVSVGLLSPQPEQPGNEASSNSAASKWECLVDPQAIEEAACSAVVRTAGTEDGLTTLLLEVGDIPLPLSALSEALRQARTARLSLLTEMQTEFTRNANQKGGGRFGQADVPKEMLGKLIGSGGSTLKGIEASTSSKILIDDDDDVFFYAPSQEHFKQADDAINEITGHAIKTGEKYQVKVVRIQDYGAFVQLPSGFQALLHISELEKFRVKKVEDVLQMGQELEVICLGKDPRGQIRLSRKALL